VHIRPVLTVGEKPFDIDGTARGSIPAPGWVLELPQEVVPDQPGASAGTSPVSVSSTTPTGRHRDNQWVTSTKVNLGHANALQTLNEVLRQRYLVRDLLWRQTCDLPWVPILLRPMTRYYACQNKARPQPAMPASLMEHRVWRRFVRLHGVAACQMPRDRRHEALADALRLHGVPHLIGVGLVAMGAVRIVSGHLRCR
jgi:hypothetical protein